MHHRHANPVLQTGYLVTSECPDDQRPDFLTPSALAPFPFKTLKTVEKVPWDRHSSPIPERQRKHAVHQKQSPSKVHWFLRRDTPVSGIWPGADQQRPNNTHAPRVFYHQKCRIHFTSFSGHTLILFPATQNSNETQTFPPTTFLLPVAPQCLLCGF